MSCKESCSQQWAKLLALLLCHSGHSPSQQRRIGEPSSSCFLLCLQPVCRLITALQQVHKDAMRPLNAMRLELASSESWEKRENIAAGRGIRGRSNNVATHFNYFLFFRCIYHVLWSNSSMFLLVSSITRHYIYTYITGPSIW